MDEDNFWNDYERFQDEYYVGSGEESGKDSDLEKRIKEKNKDQDQNANEGFLKDILTDKIRFLRDILDDIDVQIKDREALKDIIMDKFDKGICYLRTEIYELDIWGLGNNRDIDLRRSKIEKELEALKLQKRVEMRESWRDVALLKKEQREFFKQYSNALRRVKVIFPESGKKPDSDNTET